jgi:hypothetical protein
MGILRLIELHWLFFIVQRNFLFDLVDEAIELTRAALARCPPDYSYHSLPSWRPSNLIGAAGAALVFHPSGHSDRSTSLDNLPSILRSIF